MHISYGLQAGESKDRQAKIMTSSEGDKYINLGKKKRATVRTFKGITLLDIREYYGMDGQEKPGKKGISLTLDQVRHSPSFTFQVHVCLLFSGKLSEKVQVRLTSFSRPRRRNDALWMEEVHIYVLLLYPKFIFITSALSCVVFP